jgi:hypothetical protein
VIYEAASDINRKRSERENLYAPVPDIMAALKETVDRMGDEVRLGSIEGCFAFFPLFLTPLFMPALCAPCMCVRGRVGVGWVRVGVCFRLTHDAVHGSIDHQ